MSLKTAFELRRHSDTEEFTEVAHFRNFIRHKRTVITIVNIDSADQGITVADEITETAGRITFIAAFPGKLVAS